MLPVAVTKETMRHAVFDMPCQMRNAPCTGNTMYLRRVKQGSHVLQYRVFERVGVGGEGAGKGFMWRGSRCDVTQDRVWGGGAKGPGLRVKASKHLLCDSMVTSQHQKKNRQTVKVNTETK